MRRVIVVGISGSGKTTLARALASRLGVPHIELDGLRHGRGWQPRPEFVADATAAAAQPGWVVDGDYADVRDLFWPQADTLVWLDLGRPLVMARVIRRSAARAALRRELWNGNREAFRAWLDPEHPIRWAWSQHGPRRRELEARVADPRFAGLRVVRLRRAGDAGRWLATVGSQPLG
ncbi:MAG TPA: AAA family ATPase [Thermoleophilia bacterium]|nr:AAA family ATPase [Thermoleophilia bacterium]